MDAELEGIPASGAKCLTVCVEFVTLRVAFVTVRFRSVIVHVPFVRLAVREKFLLLQDCVVAVAEEFLAHGDGVCPIREWPDLNMEQGVGRRVAHGDGVAVLLERADEDVGVGRVRDGGDLDHGSRSCRGRLRC